MRPGTFIGLLACIASGWWLAHLERPKCDGAITFYVAEQVAREGKTDAEFYRQHPNHFVAGGVTVVRKSP
ncbi:hypothetical protein ACRQ5Q_14920 [Bradyrhizobium sp. PMVTL-01]|uniref:hypothetical protein n=1 Tax=Bradyrhizobium sp. PMVTL-01 TaxID=3434999 RepID=UPI003F7295A0